MKKIICISFVALFLLVSVPKADAQPFPGLLGGASGYLSPSTGVGVFFNAFQGQLIAVGGGANFVEGFCGVAPLSNPSFFVASGFVPSSILIFTAPISDIYIFACAYSFGLSEFIVLGAFDNSLAFFSMENKESQQIEDYPEELVGRLNDQVNKLLGNN